MANRFDISKLNYADTPMEGDVTIIQRDGRVFKTDFSQGSGATGINAVVYKYWDGIEIPPHKDMSIKKINISHYKEQTYTQQDTYSYNGNPLTPEIYGLSALKLGEDYMLSYKNNIYPGEAWIQVDGIGKYYGDYDVGFQISVDKGIKDATKIEHSTVILDPKVSIYDGTEKTPNLSVINADGVLVNSSKYTKSFSGNIEVGTGLITINAKSGSGYTGTRTVEFKIVKGE